MPREQANILELPDCFLTLWKRRALLEVDIRFEW